MDCFKRSFLLLVLLSASIVVLNAQEWRWAVQGGGAQSDHSQGIATDNNGNSYIIGYFSDTITFGDYELTSEGESDIFVAKTDNAGNWQWAKRAGGTSNVIGNAIAVDHNGNIYITGYFIGTAVFDTEEPTELISRRSADILVAKLDSFGNWQWAKRAGGDTNNQGWGIALDDHGNCYITGFFRDTADFGDLNLTSTENATDIFVAKLSIGGAWQWVAKGGGTGSDIGYGIDVDNQGNCYISGYFEESVTFGNTPELTTVANREAFIAKLDYRQNWEWSRQTVGAYDNRNTGDDIVVDSEGNSFIVGGFEGSVDFGETELTPDNNAALFVAKLNNEGDWLWVRKADGPRSGNVDIDSEGNAYVTGNFWEDASFGQFQLQSAGGSDIFVAKIDEEGSWRWAERAGGINNDQGRDIALNNQDDICLVGVFQNTVSFGDIQLVNPNDFMFDIFVAKLGGREFAGGSGTEQDPWLIETATHLNNVRNYSGEDHDDKHFLQVTKINLGEAPWDEDEGWVPIGNSDTYFYGTYRGGEQIIDGLSINRPDDDYQGLFGFTKNASITNLGLTNVNIIAHSIVGGLVGAQGSNVGENNGVIDECFVSGKITGEWIVGGLVGQSYDPIYNSNTNVSLTGKRNRIGGLAGDIHDEVDNCYSNGNVTGSSDSWQVGGLIGQLWSGRIKSSYATGDVSGQAYCGGLVGDGDGTIVNSYASGNITGLGDYSWTIGGLMGGSGARIDESFATGRVMGADYIGGLVGETTTNAIIRNSYARGKVIPDPDYDLNNGLGGLIGLNRGEIINSYSTGSVDGYDDIGGLVGYNVVGDDAVTNSYWNRETSGQDTSAGGEGRTTEDMVYPYAADTYVGWNFEDIWKDDPELNINSGYPYLFKDEQVSVDNDMIAEAPNNMMLTNYPNPFNPETTIYFSVKNGTEASLTIYNMKGQVVKTLHDGFINPGEQRFVWEGKDDKGRSVGSGVYLYRLKSDEYVQVNKMLMVK